MFVVHADRAQPIARGLGGVLKLLEIIALSAQFLLTNFMNNAMVTPIDVPPPA